MDTVSLIVFSVVMALWAILAILLVRLSFRSRRVFAQAVQAEMNNLILMSKLEEYADQRDSTSIENSDGFLKFVSDSRDWAFDYIENVQEAITEYDAALSSNDAKLLNDAYKKLIDFLPKDDVVK